jgi:hypothetical protein
VDDLNISRLRGKWGKDDISYFYERSRGNAVSPRLRVKYKPQRLEEQLTLYRLHTLIENQPEIVIAIRLH